MQWNQTDLLQEADVCSALGVSAETLKKMVDIGLFPDALYITERNRGWPWKDIEAFMYLRGRIGPKPPRTGEKTT